jgi:hypothetical protein
MVLSSYVPHIIDEHIEGALAPLLRRDTELCELLDADGALRVGGAGTAGGTLVDDDDILQEPAAASVAVLARPLNVAIEHWAIHPGGRSILDKTEAKLGLSEEQLLPSRETLREYGNMSSATVLFVLKAILDGTATEADQRVCAMAFGPGLTVETALMTVIAG